MHTFHLSVLRGLTSHCWSQPSAEGLANQIRRKAALASTNFFALTCKCQAGRDTDFYRPGGEDLGQNEESVPDECQLSSAVGLISAPRETSNQTRPAGLSRPAPYRPYSDDWDLSERRRIGPITQNAALPDVGAGPFRWVGHDVPDVGPPSIPARRQGLANRRVHVRSQLRS